MLSVGQIARSQLQFKQALNLIESDSYHTHPRKQHQLMLTKCMQHGFVPLSCSSVILEYLKIINVNRRWKNNNKLFPLSSCCCTVYFFLVSGYCLSLRESTAHFLLSGIRKRATWKCEIAKKKSQMKMNRPDEMHSDRS